jgi:hypothetical protein
MKSYSIIRTERADGAEPCGPREVTLLTVSSLSRALLDRRWLVPRYRLYNSLIAWECSVCAKLFSLSVEEAEQADSLQPPPCIHREFRVHNCELHLGQCSPDADLQYFSDPDV